MIALPVFSQIYFENIQSENMGGKAYTDTRFNINAKTQGLDKVGN